MNPIDQILSSEFIKGKEAFADLFQLADPKLTPVLGQAFYHFSEIRRKAIEGIENHPGFVSIKKKLREEYNFLLKDLILKMPKTQKIFIDNKNESNLNLIEWGKLIEVLPLALEQVSYFKLGDQLEVAYSKENLTISCLIENLDELSDIQFKVYQNFRKLIAHDCIPTFKIVDKNKLVFIFNFDHDSALNSVFEHEGRRLFLSNSLLKYRAPKIKLAPFQEHILIKINHSGKIQNIVEDSDKKALIKSLEADKSLSLFHLPFLFRPLSIIIHGEGRVAPSWEFISTGCEKLMTRENLSIDKYTNQAIDLFSFLGK